MGAISSIYKMLRIFNDVNAITKGKYGQRMVRKAAHKATAKALKGVK